MTIPWPSNWNPQSWTTFNPKEHKCYGCETPAPAGVIYRPRSTPWGPLLFCARCETGERGPYWDRAAARLARTQPETGE